MAIDAGGGIIVPTEYLDALGLQAGDEVVMRLGDDQLRIETIDAAIRRAQELVERHVPAERSLVDELIAERRAERRVEAARE